MEILWILLAIVMGFLCGGGLGVIVLPLAVCLCLCIGPLSYAFIVDYYYGWNLPKAYYKELEALEAEYSKAKKEYKEAWDEWLYYKEDIKALKEGRIVGDPRKALYEVYIQKEKIYKELDAQYIPKLNALEKKYLKGRYERVIRRRKK